MLWVANHYGIRKINADPIPFLYQVSEFGDILVNNYVWILSFSFSGGQSLKIWGCRCNTVFVICFLLYNSSKIEKTLGMNLGHYYLESRKSFSKN